MKRAALTIFLLSVLLSTGTACTAAEISVVATVDQSSIAFGDSFTYTITVNGAQSDVQPAITRVEGLTFEGPSMQTSVSFVNGQVSQSVRLVYRVTPARTGEFTIPGFDVTVGGRKFLTEPIAVSVGKAVVQPDLQQVLFGRVHFEPRQVYIGQVAPLDVYLFVRQDVPLRGLSGFQSEAEGLGYKFLHNVKTGQQVINGESYVVHRVEGSISPTKIGTLMFGPCVIRTQLAVEKRRRGGRGFGFDDPFFDQFFGGVEVREQPVTIGPIPIEVLPLPVEARPADFTGAVGQWSLEVDAKPTEIAVGDPITLTIKVSGNGNIDTVPSPSFLGLDDFKTYDPSVKTTKNELGTTGERIFQQVLVAKSTEAKQLPGIRLVYFDPGAREYRTVAREPIQLTVKAGSASQPAIISGGLRVPRAETLGQDIVYLKGELGAVGASVPMLSTPSFWVLNLAPVITLLCAVFWKRRVDRLQGDVAAMRRTRAAKNARKRLASAKSYEEIHRSLQDYLGDRLNLPASGITASIVDEELVPRGLDNALLGELRDCFEACDNARFAGVKSDRDARRATLEKVSRVIDELEEKHL